MAAVFMGVVPMASEQKSFIPCVRNWLAASLLVAALSLGAGMPRAVAEESGCDTPISALDGTSCGVALVSARSAIVVHNRSSAKISRQMKQTCRNSKKVARKKAEKKAKKRLQQQCVRAKSDVEAKAFAEMLLQTALGLTEEACSACRR